MTQKLEVKPNELTPLKVINRTKIKIKEEDIEKAARFVGVSPKGVLVRILPRHPNCFSLGRFLGRRVKYEKLFDGEIRIYTKKNQTKKSIIRILVHEFAHLRQWRKGNYTTYARGIQKRVSSRTVIMATPNGIYKLGKVQLEAYEEELRYVKHSRKERKDGK